MQVCDALRGRSDDPLRHLRFSGGSSVQWFDLMHRRIERRFHEGYQFRAEVGSWNFDHLRFRVGAAFPLTPKFDGNASATLGCSSGVMTL